MAIIRAAHWTDHRDLVPMVDAFALLHHQMMPDLFRSRWLGFTQAIFQTWLDDDDEIHLVAEDAGAIAGYVWAARGLGSDADYIYRRRNVFVYVLAVAGPYRRQGIGRQLFEAIEDLAVEDDAEIVQLAVVPTNDAARAFYEALGYRATSEIRTKTLRSVRRLTGS